ncbi:efflux RND transporter periplasmic adaptor subunit, partial [bacterium]|nr:efflux RND transporter periplasmic adaptor subunit [bacterium]
ELILKLIVEQYLLDGQPVSSKLIAEHQALAVSSATVRNTMVQLEQQGLIRSPHTSAGRVPTTSGIRLFIDKMLQLQPLSDKWQRELSTRLVPQLPVSLLCQQAGQLLAVLESRELAGTALELQKLSSELGLAQKKYEREELLSSKKIGTAESLQNAKQAYDSLLLENKRLRGQLRIMGVSVGEIDKVENGQDSAALFGRLSLTAPVNGRVTKVFTTIGGAIGEYQPVAEIADISKLRIKAFVGEKDIMSLLENAKTNNISGYLRVGAFKDIKFDVKFVGVDSEVSRGTRLLGVNLEVNNPDELLRPVMFAQGELFLGATEEYLLLPASAVFKDDSKNYVFVEHEDMFLMREVSVDYNYSEYALVKSGIKEGDKYVVEGSFLLQSDVFRGKMGAGCAH